MEQVDGDEPITQTESESESDMMWRLMSERFTEMTRNHEADGGLRKARYLNRVPPDSCQVYRVALQRRLLSLTALQVLQSHANSVVFPSYFHKRNVFIKQCKEKDNVNCEKRL